MASLNVGIGTGLDVSWMENESESAWEDWWAQHEAEEPIRNTNSKIFRRKTHDSIYNILQIAVIYDYDHVVRWLLTKKNHPLDQCHPDTLSPLLLAVSEGALNSLKVILTHASVHDDDKTPGKLRVLLSQSGPEEDHITHMGQAFAIYTAGKKTIFHLAVDRGRLRILEYLLDFLLGQEIATLREHLASILARTDTNGQTALDVATFKAVLSEAEVQKQNYTQMAALLAKSSGQEIVWPCKA